MIYLCVISRVSRVISRVISIICDLDAAISAISTRRLVEKRKYKQCAAARVFLRCARHPWLGAQDEENLDVDSLF